MSVNTYAYEVKPGSGLYWLSIANNGQVLLYGNRSYVLAALTGNGVSLDQSLSAHPQDEKIEENLAPVIKLLATVRGKPVFFKWKHVAYVAKNNRVYLVFKTSANTEQEKHLLSTLTKKIFG